MIKYLSIPKIALAVDVNENTIRRYIKRFPAYFVDTQIESRIIKYNPAAINILKDIKNWYQDKGYDRDTIREKLKLKYSKDTIDKLPDIHDTQDDRLAKIEKRVEDIAKKLNKLLQYFQKDEQAVNAPVDNLEQKADTPEQDISIIDDILTGTPEQVEITLTDIHEQLVELPESIPDLATNQSKPELVADSMPESVTKLVTKPISELVHESSVGLVTLDLQDYEGKKLTTPERDILLLKVKQMFIDEGKKASRLSVKTLNDAGIFTATGKTWTVKKFSDNYRLAKKRADKETSKD